jgi:inner membrane protein
MDNLTHTLTGLFLSRAGLNRLTPNASAILMVAANAPDIDVLSAAGGSLNYLHYHRQITHSLAAMPVMAILSVLLVRAVSRKPVSWMGAFCAALIGVASHLLLDWTNSYGIRLLLPFSGEWLRLDWTEVIDVWIWAVLLLALAAPFLARLVGSEISSGALRQRYPGRGFPIFALCFALLYTYGRGTLHARAVGELQSRIYGDSPPLRVAALPNAVNPLEWRGLVETSETYAVTAVNLTQPFDPMRAQIFHKPDPDPASQSAIDAAKRSPAFQQFLRFSQFPFWRVLPADEPENAKLVEVMDMRFGSPTAPGFMVSAVVDSRLRVVRTAFQFGAARPQ